MLLEDAERCPASKAMSDSSYLGSEKTNGKIVVIR